MVSSASSDNPHPSDAADPVAVVAGEPLTQLPLDLYIPPDALAVFLEQFEGPLDLLLYLIRRQNLDILAIPVADVTRQYLAYLEMMQSLKIELAAEYLLMAAWLAEIKSRMMLPPSPNETGDEDEDADPRAALVERLLAYERLKHAAGWLDDRPRIDRDFFALRLTVDWPETPRVHPEVPLADLVATLRRLVRQGELVAAHEIQSESLSIRGRMSDILAALEAGASVTLTGLLRPEEGRMGVAVSVVALLELAKAGMVDWQQAGPFEEVTVAHV